MQVDHLDAAYVELDPAVHLGGVRVAGALGVRLMAKLNTSSPTMEMACSAHTTHGKRSLGSVNGAGSDTLPLSRIHEDRLA